MRVLCLALFAISVLAACGRSDHELRVDARAAIAEVKHSASPGHAYQQLHEWWHAAKEQRVCDGTDLAAGGWWRRCDVPQDVTRSVEDELTRLHIQAVRLGNPFAIEVLYSKGDATLLAHFAPTILNAADRASGTRLTIAQCSGSVVCFCRTVEQSLPTAAGRWAIWRGLGRPASRTPPTTQGCISCRCTITATHTFGRFAAWRPAIAAMNWRSTGCWGRFNRGRQARQKTQRTTQRLSSWTLHHERRKERAMIRATSLLAKQIGRNTSACLLLFA
jgi:hypothetical protein